MALSPSIMTAIGRAKLASATPEQQLRVAFLAVGDGGGVYEPIHESMTALVREVWRGEASHPIRDDGNASVLMFETVIPANVGGFFLREVALFDSDGDMIAIGQIALIEKVGEHGTSPITLTIRFRLALSNTQDVTLFYQDSPAISHQGLSERHVFGAHKAVDVSFQPRDGSTPISVQKAIEDAAASGGVTLDGPGKVFADFTAVYTITNFNSLSMYAVDLAAGTATINHDQITIETPPTLVIGDYFDFTVRRDGVPTKFKVAVASARIVKPYITYPSQGAADVPVSPTFAFSDFVTAPPRAGTQTGVSLQISASPTFTPVLWSHHDESNITSLALPPGVLSPGQTYYARLRQSALLEGVHTLGDWSDTRTFSALNRYVQAPTVTVAGLPAAVGETPTISTSPFSVFNGTDVHASTDWRITRVSDSALIWENLGDAVNKISIAPPSGLLAVSENYIFSAKHNGATLPSSVFGTVMAKTAPEFFEYIDANIGRAHRGGFYAGKIQQSDGVYALIVAPKVAEASLAFGPNRPPAGGGGFSRRDGYANSMSLILDGGDFPAARYCRSYIGGGFTDWYLPSINELNVLYRNLKPDTQANWTSGGANPDMVPPQNEHTITNPAQTQAAAFRTGSSEAFSVNSSYWSSTVSSINATSAIDQWLTNGGQGENLVMTLLRSTRPVRRIKISS